jgi:hypothetical protein
MQKPIFKLAMMCLIKGMRPLHLFLLLLLPAAFISTGCSTADTNVSNGNVDASGQTVSSVPWNKPEQWETSGQLGGMTGQ